MKLNYIHALLILGIALFFAPAVAQNKKTATKQTKAAAQKLGNAAAKSPQDTTRKGGQNAGNNPEKNGGSLSEEIVVTTAYKPVLADAVKIRRNPDLEDKTPFKAPLSYKPIDKRLELNSNIKQMDAMKMPAELDSTLYNNYVRAGLGSLKTTFGELYINNGRDAALQTGAYFKHFAQQGNLYKQKQSKDEVAVFGKSIGNVNSLSGRIMYNRLGSNFYGYDTYNPPTTLDVAKQHFSTLGAEGELVKNYKDVPNDFTYALKAKGYLFSDAFHARENNLVLSGFINQTIKQFYTGLNASIDVSTQKDSPYSLSNNLVRLNPYLKFQGENYKIDAGVNIVSEFGFSSRFFIFPAAKLEFQVIPKYVRLFAEAKGDVNRSSLRDFFEINPFLGQNLTIKNSVDQLDLAAGLKGMLAPGLGFKATFFRNDVKNLPLMLSNFNFANGYNRFTVVYDDGRAKISGFTGELDYKASDDVDVFGKIEFRDYKLATEAQPWNLPKFILTAGTNLHITDKISLNGTLLLRGDAKDKTTTATSTDALLVNIKSFADINAGAQYKVNNRIGIFLQVNNLLATGYQNWLYYPNYGFNIFGGVSYGF